MARNDPWPSDKSDKISQTPLDKDKSMIQLQEPRELRQLLRLLLAGHAGIPIESGHQEPNASQSLAARCRRLLFLQPGLRGRIPLSGGRQIRPGLRRRGWRMQSLHRSRLGLLHPQMRPQIRLQVPIRRRSVALAILVWNQKQIRFSSVHYSFVCSGQVITVPATKKLWRFPWSSRALCRCLSKSTRTLCTTPAECTSTRSFWINSIRSRWGADWNVAQLKFLSYFINIFVWLWDAVDQPRRSAGRLRHGWWDRRGLLDRQEQLGHPMGRGRLLPHPPGSGRVRNRKHRRRSYRHSLNWKKKKIQRN